MNKKLLIVQEAKEQLANLNIDFNIKSEWQLEVFGTNSHTYDFWPSTGKWVKRDSNVRGNGLQNMLRDMRDTSTNKDNISSLTDIIEINDKIVTYKNLLNTNKGLLIDAYFKANDLKMGTVVTLDNYIGNPEMIIMGVTDASYDSSSHQVSIEVIFKNVDEESNEYKFTLKSSPGKKKLINVRKLRN